MATKQFLPWATGGGAYVLSPAAYAGLAARNTGLPPGLAPKENINTPLRQGAFVAAALSQWASDTGGLDTLDDGNIANWITAFTTALSAQLASGNFIPYAGNPNGNVAGVAGNAASVPKVFPTVVWDTTNTIWWVCTVTGNAAAAVWVPVGDDAEWPYYCTQTGGTANAPVLSTPAIMDRLVAGSMVAWQATTGPNTGAVNVTVGAFGVKALYKEGPAGPTPLLGGEIQVGNILTARYDGVRLQLVATALGTAALANASSATGVVSAVQGPTTVGHLAVFSDVNGTIIDGGLAGGLPPVYIDNTYNGQILAPGVFLVDTSGGPFTIKLQAGPAHGVCYEFIDATGAWDYNFFTVDRNGQTVMGNAENLVCNVGGEDFRLWYSTANDWRLQ